METFKIHFACKAKNLSVVELNQTLTEILWGKLERIQEGVKYTRACLTNSSCDLFIFSCSNKEFDEPAGNQAGFQQASGELVSIK